jgi:hypothetical protein
VVPGIYIRYCLSSRGRGQRYSARQDHCCCLYSRRSCGYSLALALLPVSPDTIGTIDTNINDYILAPQSVQAKANDFSLLKVFQWLQYLRRPDGLSDTEYATFMRYCMDFFIDNNRLWRKDSHGAHKPVISPGRQLDIISTVHDLVGHKAFYTTKAHISQHFWWPSMGSDIPWYTKTCHI